MKFEFSENNSGGYWWMGKSHYDALLEAGWTYVPSKYDIQQGYDKKSWGGKDDLVPYGWRHGLSGEFPNLQAAVENWEKATGLDFFAEGCNCCGAPFSITGEDGSLSGDSVERVVVRPW